MVDTKRYSSSGHGRRHHRAGERSHRADLAHKKQSKHGADRKHVPGQKKAPAAAKKLAAEAPKKPSATEHPPQPDQPIKAEPAAKHPDKGEAVPSAKAEANQAGDKGKSAPAPAANADPKPGAQQDQRATEADPAKSKPTGTSQPEKAETAKTATEANEPPKETGAKPATPTKWTPPEVQPTQSAALVKQSAFEAKPATGAEGVTTGKAAMAALQAMAPKAALPPANDPQAAEAKRQMELVAAAAEQNSGGKDPSGWCGREVKDSLERLPELPFSKIPRMPYARDYATFLNEGDNAAKYGLERLNLQDPHKAPRGSIIVVRAGTPGTHHPFAGDITIAMGGNRFLNDGEMKYGDPKHFRTDQGYVLGIYAPVGASKVQGTAGKYTPADQLGVASLRKIVPGLPEAKVQEVLPVLQTALRAAEADTPERAAAFLSQVALGTKGLTAPTSLGFVVDATRTWREKQLNSVADKKDISQLREALGIPKAAKGSGDDLEGLGDSQYDALIRNYSAEYGVPPRLIKSMMKRESGFSTRATSNKGAMGLLQLMPGTFATMARRYGIEGGPYDIESNLRAGIAYMGEQMKTFHGNVDLALAAYNAGPGAVLKYGYSVPPYKETQDYVRIIKGFYGSAGTADGADYYHRALEELGGGPSHRVQTGRRSHLVGRSHGTRRAAHDAFQDVGRNVRLMHRPNQPPNQRDFEAYVGGVRKELDQVKPQDSEYLQDWDLMSLILNLLLDAQLRQQLEANPAFQAFVRERFGLTDWTPGQPLDPQIYTEFLGGKLEELAAQVPAAQAPGETPEAGREAALKQAAEVLKQQLQQGSLTPFVAPWDESAGWQPPAAEPAAGAAQPN